MLSPLTMWRPNTTWTWTHRCRNGHLLIQILLHLLHPLAGTVHSLVRLIQDEVNSLIKSLDMASKDKVNIVHELESCGSPWEFQQSSGHPRWWRRQVCWRNFLMWQTYFCWLNVVTFISRSEYLKVFVLVRLPSHLLVKSIFVYHSGHFAPAEGLVPGVRVARLPVVVPHRHLLEGGGHPRLLVLLRQPGLANLDYQAWTVTKRNSQ